MGIYGQIIFALNEMEIYGRPDGFLNKTKLDTSDLNEMKKKLVACAKSNKFSKEDYEDYWGDPKYFDDEENEKEIKRFKTYKLGYCFTDEYGDYICYEFNKDKFFFFDHECSGCDNMDRGPVSLEWIKKTIDEFQKIYFK